MTNILQTIKHYQKKNWEKSEIEIKEVSHAVKIVKQIKKLLIFHLLGLFAYSRWQGPPRFFTEDLSAAAEAHARQKSPNTTALLFRPIVSRLPFNTL